MIEKSLKCIVFSFLCAFNLYISPAGMGIKNIYAGLSQKELAEEIQKGQDAINQVYTSGSLEEQQAFEAAMMEMLNNLSDEDIAEINAIAEAIGDQITFDQPKIQEPKETAKSTDKKTDTAAKIITDDSIEGLLLSINKTIDTVLIKVESDVLVSEYFGSHSEKSSIALFQRFISLLNTKQNLKNLSNKNDENSKKLVVELKAFKKDITAQEAKFHIDDAFGAASKSKLSYKENIKQLDALIEHFNKALDNLLPQIEKFIRQYESEMQELEALYEKLKASSQKHAKSAQTKKGTAPVKPTPSNQQGAAGQPAQQGNASYNNGYYPYDNNYYDPYNNYYDPATDNKGDTNKAVEKKDGDKSHRPQANNNISVEESALNEILDLIEDYNSAFDDAKKNISTFYATCLANYPQYEKMKPADLAGASQEEVYEHMIAFCPKINEYAEKMEEEKFKKIDTTLVSLGKTLDAVYKIIPKLDLPQIKKLEEHSAFKDIIKLAEESSRSIDSFSNGLKTKKDANFAALDEAKNTAKTKIATRALIPSPTMEQLTDAAMQEARKAYDFTLSQRTKEYRLVKNTSDILQRAVKSAAQRKKRPRKADEVKKDNKKNKS